MSRQQLLDVRDLEPPEPLVRVLTATDTLKPGEYLRVLSQRDPVMLYPLLMSQGFEYERVAGSAGVYEILIWRAGDSSAEREIHS
jgi:TusA-related sulfurtransferase